MASTDVLNPSLVTEASFIRREEQILSEIFDASEHTSHATITASKYESRNFNNDAGCDVSLPKSWPNQTVSRNSSVAVLAELNVDHIKSGGLLGMQKQGVQYILQHEFDDSFYVVDLGNVTRLLKAWRAAMPRVQPYYAVKCNPEPGTLKLMVAMGMGFDCASKREVEMMLGMGVPQSKIIFAHPCKRRTDIAFAKEHGVEHTTFDTESELHKIALHNPGFKCVLRIRADDPEARVPLGLKYGADMEDTDNLLECAKNLGLRVVGVSFHVGSACKNLATFTSAVQKCRQIFDKATHLGFKMELLDIGGGFTGHFDSHGNVIFGEIASTINTALAMYFPPEEGTHIIAEPGRYFAETSATLFTPIYGTRDRHDPVTGAVKKDYFITDGLYGSFNCMLYDGQNPSFKVVRSPVLPGCDDPALHLSTIWGPTCDSADCLYKDVKLPELRTGDWLMWTNAGAYTWAGACDFNGIEFTRPNRLYVFSESAVDDLGTDSEDVLA